MLGFLAGPALGSIIGGGSALGVGSLLGSGKGKGLVSSLLKPITGGLGGVVENGFDFKCWNSAYSPSKAKKEGPTYVEKLVQISGFNETANATNFNKALFNLYGAAHSAEKGRDCTLRGQQVLKQILLAGAERMLLHHAGKFEKVKDRLVPAGEFELNFVNEWWKNPHPFQTPVFRDKTTKESFNDALTGGSDYRPTRDDAYKETSPLTGTGHVTLPGDNAKSDNTLLFVALGVLGFLLLKKK